MTSYEQIHTPAGKTTTRPRRSTCMPKKLHRITSGILGKDFPSKFSISSGRSGYNAEYFGEGASGTSLGQKNPCAEKPALAHWRIANCSDCDDIIELIDNGDHSVDELFSSPKIPDLIEKSAFALVQFNINDELVSFTSAFSYPNIPAVPSFDWYLWLEKLYQTEGITPHNAYFIHYIVGRPDYSDDFLPSTLETMFMEFPFLKYIIIVKPPLINMPDQFGYYFIPLFPRDIHKYGWDSNSVQTLMLCPRYSLLDRLNIRLAIVEDHDDLMPIIERQTTRLRELYGDFCMAEIIEFPGTEDRKTLVCEVMGYAVAFMNLNRAIDLELLNQQFDLAVFHGLRKPTDQDVSAETIQEGGEKVVYIPEKVDPTLTIINSETLDLVMNWKPEICAMENEAEATSTTSNDSSSASELIKKSLEANIVSKFSAYSLGPLGANDSHKLYSNSEFGEYHGSIKTELSLISLQQYNLPVYHGPSNVFCIEMFAVREDFDEKLCTDFLEAAFELFPDLEYCAMTIPSQCNTFPLLDLFIRVTPRPLKRFKQELYICHRSSIMITMMRVRRITKSDLDEVYRLLRGISTQEIIFADIANSCIFSDSAYSSFVLVCSRAIVGVAVVCYEEGLEYLTDHYKMSELIDFDLHRPECQAVLKHLVLSPIYQTHARFFLRDVMRMADLTALYRARYEDRQSRVLKSSLITVLAQFVPVKPRRMINYHVPSLGENVPPPHLLNEDEPFALYHINSRICGLRKFTSNINLVIVGASRTAFSFLENLLYAPSAAYVTYTNITLVSPHGLGIETASHPARDIMFPYKGKYNMRYRAQISLQTFVNFVYGVMTEINRSEKYITINYDAIIRYDFLLLLCGKQHFMPVPLVREVDYSKCGRGSRPRCSLFKYLVNQKKTASEDDAPVHPTNVFLVNSLTDATNSLIMIQYYMRKIRNDPPEQHNEKIIIYGVHLRSYTCIQSLLKFGVPSTMIVLVEPTQKTSNCEIVFQDPNVDAAVTEIIKELGIEHYRNYILYDWTFCGNNQIDTVTFHGKHRKITLKVLAMFPFESKLVSDVTFKAVNEASLVYDGRLVINHKFQTNDPYIYSAGPITKYQRKYYAKDSNHEYYSSNEIGKLLAEVIRVEIDPTVDHARKDDQDNGEIPKLVKPLVFLAQLPGDWNYFRIGPPGTYVPLEAQYNLKDCGDVLITGDCKMTNGYGYFKIHLDEFGTVRSIVCFTKDEIDAENLSTLYGLHERFFNNLLVRFNLGLINDFYSYFREPWSYALYHEKFGLLRQANREYLSGMKTEEEDNIESIIEEVLKKKNYERLDEDELGRIFATFDNSYIKSNIVSNVYHYLQKLSQAFPMYANPGILRILLGEASTSMLHKPMTNECNSVYGAEYKTSIKISDTDYKT